MCKLELRKVRISTIENVHNEHKFEIPQLKIELQLFYKFYILIY